MQQHSDAARSLSWLSWITDGELRRFALLHMHIDISRPGWSLLSCSGCVATVGYFLAHFLTRSLPCTRSITRVGRVGNRSVCEGGLEHRKDSAPSVCHISRPVPTCLIQNTLLFFSSNRGGTLLFDMYIQKIGFEQRVWGIRGP